jgi:GMP synthase (glutamine-hydrolysing)
MAPQAKAIVLQHAPHEGPGRVRGAFERAGFEVAVRRLFAGAPMPELHELDALILMGGPMGLGDLHDPRYPFLSPEIELVRACLAAGKPLFGICLGAQLLAYAAGARVFAMSSGDEQRSVREVGWGAVHFVASAAEEPLLEGLGLAELVLHWHGDTFELPLGARLLASSLPCEHQMFRLGKALGIQFHIEVDELDIERWLEEDALYVEGALGPSGAARIRRDTQRFMPSFREFGDKLLERIARGMLE